ncbi:MAG: dTDP-glucose 4,6-dehydratase [Planctomycetota bacterium]|nr:MAG: dTDP-glucose 4,6-dehydratase [Planctomycetota bacterium]
MQTILVTGGAGFIGSHFVRSWITTERGRLVNLDKLTYAGNLDSLCGLLDNPSHTFVQGDIGDAELTAGLLAEHRPTAIVNFAAESHVDRSIEGSAEFVNTNVVGTHRLLEASLAYFRDLGDEERQAFRFLHISTDEVYGSLGPTGRFVEETPYAPRSPYSASKAAADHFVRAYHHTHRLPTLITNCSNNFGPYQFPEKLIPLMILNALEGRPLPIYGDGQNVRDWLYVEDHCEALLRVLERGQPGETYNIGGKSERTNKDVVDAICQIVDDLNPTLAHRPCRSLITYVTDRPGHDRRYAVDCGKIQSELGWQPSVDFETGLEKTVRWYMENASWVERVTSGKYQRERLGLNRV